VTSARRLEVIARYSFKGGMEILQREKPHLLGEVEEAIRAVDPTIHMTKQSKEERRQKRMLYAPMQMNDTMAASLRSNGWFPKAINVSTTVEETGSSYSGPRTVDGFKERVGLEIQFGKYSFMLYDMVGKLVIFKNRDLIDYGIEVVPMKTLAVDMSSGVSFFEQLKADLEARGVADIDIPIAVLGIGIPGANIDRSTAQDLRERDREEVETLNLPPG